MFKGDSMDCFYEDRFKRQYDNIPLSIYSNTDFSYRAHWHTEFELAYVDSGTTIICINNDRRRLSAGDIAICTSGDIHYYESTSTSAKMLLLVFKPEFFGFPANWPDTYQFTSHFYKKEDMGSKAADKIKNLLLSILEEKQAKHEFYELVIKAKVIELCAALLRYLPTNKNGTGNIAINSTKLKVVKDILVYIENNLTEDISLHKLAEKFNIDSSYLSKIFNSVTGKNFKTYINTLRVYKAESIILNSQKPMVDIAIECGFNSVRTFNRAFKAIKGYIPSSVRNKIQ